MAVAAGAVERAACGLNTFLLKPKDLKGEILFKHMVQQCLNDTNVKSHVPLMCLDVQHSEAQIKEFGPDTKDLRKCSITSHAHGAGATLKLVTQKIDDLRYVKSYDSMHNDPEWLHRSRDRVEFSQLLTVIAVLEQQDVVQAKVVLAKELRAMAPSTKIKLLQNNNDVSKLTKKKIMSLLLTWFAVKDDAHKNLKVISLLY
jgi:hypothetical protein